MPNYNSPRFQWLFSQIQTGGYNVVNNTGGTWSNSAAQLIRIPEGSFSASRSAPYTPFPVLTGTRSMVPGIRGRKNGPAFSISGLPIIPSGTAGTPPEMATILQNIFGVGGTVVASTSVTYGPFVDSGNFPLTLLYFNNSSTSFTQFYYWGCFVRQWKIDFNGPFLTIDIDGFFGWGVDSTAFSIQQSQGGAASLTSFPTAPVSPTVVGQPIAGFGSGYNCTIASQSVELKTRVLSITGETGWVPIQDVLGSAYPIAAVGDTRRMAFQLQALDDDSTALNTLKTDADTDNSTYSMQVVAGAAAGSIVTANLNNVQINDFNLVDQGAIMMCDIPTSYGHASAIGQSNDFSLIFT